jgi:hypothetical protein
MLTPAQVRGIPKNPRVAETVHRKASTLVRAIAPADEYSQRPKPPKATHSLCQSPVPVRCRTGFSFQPDRLNPQSQSFSRSYGSNLPTSLTYIVLLARGCSPRRPAADMGTIWRENFFFYLKIKTLPRIFKGQRECTGHRESRGAFGKQRPSLRLGRFQGVRSLRRKDNSSRDSR